MYGFTEETEASVRRKIEKEIRKQFFKLVKKKTDQLEKETISCFSISWIGLRFKEFCKINLPISTACHKAAVSLFIDRIHSDDLFMSKTDRRKGR